MELKWLEDFVSVADLHNFSRAAVARHASQPALSRRIKALELWYGVPLVDRSAYPVTLTAAGTSFLPIARRVATDIYRSRREARAESGVAGRSFKFAMPHALAVYFFPSWWRRQKRHEDARATVVAADFDDCVDLLRSGACQYLLCYTQDDLRSGFDDQGLSRMKIGADRLVPVSAVDKAGHPTFELASGSNRSVPLLAYTRTSFLGRIAGDLYSRLEGPCRLELRYESALVEALKAEAIVGEGIAWLPLGTVGAEMSSGMLTTVGDESSTLSLSIWLFRPSAAMRSAGAADFGTADAQFVSPRSIDESVSHHRGDSLDAATNPLTGDRSSR